MHRNDRSEAIALPAQILSGEVVVLCIRVDEAGLEAGLADGIEHDGAVEQRNAHLGTGRQPKASQDREE